MNEVFNDNDECAFLSEVRNTSTISGIVNGPNGTQFIIAGTIISLAVCAVVAYGLKLDYQPSVNLGIAQFALTKPSIIA